MEEEHVKQLDAFIRFSRLHTIIATTLQVTGLFILASGPQGPGLEGLVFWGLALISCLAANIYIVGLNQLVDVDIDRINKPYLPLAAGDFTMRQGRIIVAVMGLLSLGIAVTQGLALFLTVVLAVLIGTIYSLPPLRLKRYAAWAALSIAFVRGFVSNVGLYLYFHRALQPLAEIPWLLIAGLAFFFFGYGLVIALYKDIPDLAGDREFGIRTFTVRLGPEVVFRAGRWLLTGFYLIPIVAAATQLPALDSAVFLLGQLLVVGLFWYVSRSVNPTEPAAITRFYMFLWSLFYAEYVLLGLSALLQSGAGTMT